MFVIIPVKPFSQAKTRLAPALTPEQRAWLSRRLLLRTIELAHQVGEVVIISRDAGVRRLAKQAGAWALIESGTDLNEALQQASHWVTACGGEAILILPGDLPLLQEADLAEMIRMGQQTPVLVIAPCHRHDGTNALLLRPPGLIPFAFGPGSFAKHLQAAYAANLEPIIYHSPSVALDLDLPGDLAAWQNQASTNPRSI